ncbi:hypothetical protein [Kutzneria sp. NPDC051319]|uniref:hypothetical protein n=1 Tax=Kutzneria sp. NPDC051319 TaxID=3155047 RepID=UPI0034305923
MAALMALLATVAIVGVQLFVWVGQGARDLRETGLAPTRLSLVGVPVDYATVRWIDPGRKPSSIVDAPMSGQTSPPRLLIILNQTATTYALYDCRTGEPHIVNAADVVVDRIQPPRGTNKPLWIAIGTGCADRRWAGRMWRDGSVRRSCEDNPRTWMRRCPCGDGDRRRDSRKASPPRHHCVRRMSPAVSLPGHFPCCAREANSPSFPGQVRDKPGR